jgi:RNA polymerase sigma-70 factor (ECF subfamily)
MMMKNEAMAEACPPGPLMHPPEEAGLLIARVQAGDRLAFREFIEKYQRLVAAVVYRMVYNPADREELSQEIFLKIFSHIGSFQGGDRMAAWIGRIAGNTCINHLRRKRLPLYDDVAGPEADLGNVAGDGPTPERVSEQADLNAGLRREIDRLPGHYRLILTLFHFSGMNYEEISRSLDMPAGTVKSHLFRARQKLRERLQPSA